MPELQIDRAAIDAEYQELTGGLSDLDREQLSKTAARTAVLLKTPERVERICTDIAKHFQEKVAPNGFGAQVVTYDRESCVLYKRALDRVLPAEMSDVVMTVNSGEGEYAAYRRDKDAEERLLDRFRNPNDPLKVLIVTSKLLTGFDAPILQTMYLDKPLRDHALLQAICRTNRPYGETKTHGLIVDYLGVFDDVAQAIQFDEEGITRVVSNLNELVTALPAAVQKCLAWFSGVDRTVTGYEGLIAAQECLPDNETRDGFAADYSYLARLWDAVSPDPSLEPYEADHGWLGQVYESLKPSTGTGKLLWHTLGAKTIDLIHRHVHVEAVRDNLETLVLDADVLDAVLGTTDPEKKSKEIEIRVAERLRRHLHDPRFRALGERLEELRRKHEQGLLVSIEFLKSLLELAHDVVEAELRSLRASSNSSVQVPPAPGPGAVRPGLWLYSAALLRLARTPSARARRTTSAVYGPHRIGFRSAAAAFAGVPWKRSQRSERQISASLRGEDCHFHVSGAPHAPRTLRQYPCGELTPSDPGFDERPVAFPEDGSGPQIWHTFEIGTPNP